MNLDIGDNRAPGPRCASFFAEQRRRVKGRRDPIYRVPRGRVAGPSLASEVAPRPVGRDQSRPYAPSRDAFDLQKMTHTPIMRHEGVR